MPLIAPCDWLSYDSSKPLADQHNAPIGVCLSGEKQKYVGISVASAPGEGCRTDVQRAARRKRRAEGRKA